MESFALNDLKPGKGYLMKTKILVIDDEESIRFSFQKFLSADGHCVVTAESYKQAITLMNGMSFDLILADIVLGNGCGIDILEEVAKRRIKTAVIIMTAYPSSKTTENVSEMNAEGYLIKPIRQNELVLAVNRVLKTEER